MKFVYCDGGQAEHRSLRSGYCGVRAFAIAEQMPWVEAERYLKARCKGPLSKGIMKDDYADALKEAGYRWLAAPKFDGRKARAIDLFAYDRVIARQASHFTCVLSGTVFDIWDCSHKMVYGFWAKGVDQ